MEFRSSIRRNWRSLATTCTLTGRIDAGPSGALLAAHAANTDREGRILLQWIIDEVVSRVSETIDRKGIKELQRLAGVGLSSPMVPLGDHVSAKE